MKVIRTSIAAATLACLCACNNTEYKPNIETTASPKGTNIFCINSTELQNSKMV